MPCDDAPPATGATSAGRARPAAPAATAWRFGSLCGSALVWVACAPEPAPVTVAPEPKVAQAPGPRVLDPALHHVGDDVVADWAEVASAEPEGTDLTVTFDAEANASVASIELVHRGVQGEWTVSLGAQRLGILPQRREERVSFYDVPLGTIETGVNVLRVHCDDPSDDIIIGNVTLHPRSTRAVLDERHSLGDLRVRVSSAGSAVPARISVVDATGSLQRLYATDEFAIRPGVAYTDGAGLDFALPAGTYDVYATRGMEWSLAHEHVTVERGQSLSVDLAVVREVDTTGWVAADTHIHTLTYAHHGDALIDERMLSLAGEGVELAIATDHNHNVDYRGPQQKMGMQAWFTPVTGNEVTTPVGHFNAFPLDPDGVLPPHEHTHWPTLVQGMRDAGARVVILNHPHWPSITRGPLARAGVDPVTGARWGDPSDPDRLSFDALELINSTTLDADPLPLLEDWFALLNRGERLVGLGSSDSHTIGDPVGQGRTYVHMPDTDAANLDLDAAYHAFQIGDVSVSLGIFAELRIGDGNKDSTMGTTIETRAKSVNARVRIAAPSWIHPQTLHLVVNGEVVETHALGSDAGDAGPAGGPTNQWFERELKLPRYDSWITAFVTGEGVDLPGWPTTFEYTLAVTNPIYVERDRRSGWSAPRQTAERRIDAAGGSLRRIETAIDRADSVMAPLMHDVVRDRVDAIGPLGDESRSRSPAHRHPIETDATDDP